MKPTHVKILEAVLTVVLIAGVLLAMRGVTAGPDELLWTGLPLAVVAGLGLAFIEARR